jgi:L-amino acid N-acyltransferase YncA
MIIFRPSKLEDAAAINSIYNEVILNTQATFDLEPKTLEERIAWLKEHDEMHPVIVAEIEGFVAGWAALSRWSDKNAYDSTAEVSVYVDKNHRNKGIGKKLLDLITIEGRSVGLHCILSRITEGNEVSINVHVALGYKHIGVMKEVGFKFGKYLDVYLLQRLFE